MDSSRAIYKRPEVPYQKHEATDCPRSRPFFLLDVREMGMPVMRIENN